MNDSLIDGQMKAKIASMYENLDNENLIMIAMNALKELQRRYQLCDCLTEMTYNYDIDKYDYIYSETSFETTISDFMNYLKSLDYKVVENRKKKD